VLVQLQQIGGVQRTYSNPSGTYVRLDLHPGADPRKVAEQAQHIVRREVDDRTLVPTQGSSASEAQRHQWQDERQVSQAAAAETRADPADDSPSDGALAESSQLSEAISGHTWLVALLVAVLAVVIGWLFWQRRRVGAAGEPGAD
jgi:hypothetical protein